MASQSLSQIKIIDGGNYNRKKCPINDLLSGVPNYKPYHNFTTELNDRKTNGCIPDYKSPLENITKELEFRNRRILF